MTSVIKTWPLTATVNNQCSTIHLDMSGLADTNVLRVYVMLQLCILRTRSIVVSSRLICLMDFLTGTI